MIQRFIQLGEGYTDLYELIELAKTNKDRLHMLLRLDTTINNEKKSSLVVILNPVTSGNFMPLYICLEGIYNPDHKVTERYRLFNELAKTLDIPIHRLEVKASNQFEEKELYYQYLIGVLRMNRYIPPFQIN